MRRFEFLMVTMTVVFAMSQTALADVVVQNGDAAEAPAAANATEPNAEIARLWFPDLGDRPGVKVFTPVGWKDYNGRKSVCNGRKRTHMGNLGSNREPGFLREAGASCLMYRRLSEKKYDHTRAN